MRHTRRWLAIALGADLLGATGVLLGVGRGWQRVVVTRKPPLPDAIVHLSGRDLHGAIAAFSLIALAGVVAIAATRRAGRRVVGAALVISGGVIVWFASAGLSPVSAARARSSVVSGVGVDASSQRHVDVSVGWPVLTLLCGLLIVLAGALTIAFAARWSAMAARYEAPTAAALRDRPATDIALWSALDRGDDPTVSAETS